VAHADPKPADVERRALGTFGALLLVFATVAYLPIMEAGALDALGGWALPLIMWAPGIAALTTSLWRFRSLYPLGLGGTRRTPVWLIVGLLLPLAYTLAIYLPLAALGIVELGRRNFEVEFLTLGLLQSLLFATGEELGWRGLAAPLLARRLGFLRGQIVLGAVWYLYHVPAIVFAGYGGDGPRLFGHLMFLTSVVALTVFLGWSRIQSESVWPAALFHASHNCVFLHLFDPMKRLSPAAPWLVGELGALLAFVLVLLAVMAARAQARQGA
jgi:membrane protease YdiL (CAAX protease family)